MKNVSNFGDRLKQCRKFISGKWALKKYFPTDILMREYKIPFTLKARTVAKVFFRDPFWTSLALIEIFANRLATFRMHSFDPLSEPHLSSKKLNGRFRVRVYSSVDESLRRDWKLLWENTPSSPITSSPEWFESAENAFGKKDANIIALYDLFSGNLVAVLPLVKVRLGGKRILTAPGVEFLTHAPILGDLGDDEISGELLKNALALGTLVIPAFYIDEADKLAASGRNAISLLSDEEFLMDFSRGRYGDIRMKKIKQSLERIKKISGPISFSVEEGREESLQECFQIDKESIKRQRGKGVFWRADARRFYSELFRKLPKHFSISILSFNGLPASYWMFFVRGGAYMATQKAYVSGYEYYNPGFITFTKFLDSIGSVEGKTISLGLGKDRFKTDFTDRTRFLYTLIASNSFSARVYLFVYLRVRDLSYKAVAAYPKIYAQFKRIKNLFSNYE